ncbi:MAG: type IX secretion system outer membrane channel protein PorV [Chitinophagaceae bacterium]|nr:type IX secretion system outer membrane channel protein PorV [Chitinophagaceae bacterium]
MLQRIAIASLGVLSASLCTQTVNAQTKVNGQKIAVTTAVPVLRISPDSRAGAMGDVGIATDADANAQYWNVGKIPFAKKKSSISLSYTPWLKDLVPDVFLAYVAGYTKFGKDDNQAISGGLRYFSLGNINYTDINQQSLGTGMPREFALDFGYSRRLSTYLSTGVSLRYINSSLATGAAGSANINPGNAVAGDIGVYYNRTTELDNDKASTFAAGAVLSNIGSKISYTATRRDFIPTNLGLGVAYTYKADPYNKITLALDVNKLLVPGPESTTDTAGNISYFYPDKGVVSGVLSSFGDPAGIKRVNAALGAEYWYQDQFAVRAGYYYEHKENGDRRYLTCGIGVRYTVFNLNVAYLVPSGSGINRNPLSNTVRFSLAFDFDSFNDFGGGNNN